MHFHLMNMDIPRRQMKLQVLFLFQKIMLK